MANELSLSVSLGFTKGSVALTHGKSKSITVTGNALIDNIQTVGTAAEAILIGDIATTGVVYAENLDSANYVDISPDGIAPTVRLKAGEIAIFRAAAALQAKANTAACRVRFIVFED